MNEQSQQITIMLDRGEWKKVFSIIERYGDEGDQRDSHQSNTMKLIVAKIRVQLAAVERATTI